MVKSHSISPVAETFNHRMRSGYRTIAVHHENCSVPAFFKVSIDHQFDNRESGKESIVWKKSRNSLEIWIQKSVRTLKIN